MTFMTREDGSCIRDATGLRMLAPVGLPRHLWPGVREWGLPSYAGPGQFWRTADDGGRIVMMVAHKTDSKMVSMPSFDLVESDQVENWPDGWAVALKEYAEVWPSSARKHREITARLETP